LLSFPFSGPAIQDGLFAPLPGCPLSSGKTASNNSSTSFQPPPPSPSTWTQHLFFITRLLGVKRCWSRRDLPGPLSFFLWFFFPPCCKTGPRFFPTKISFPQDAPLSLSFRCTALMALSRDRLPKFAVPLVSLFFFFFACPCGAHLPFLCGILFLQWACPSLEHGTDQNEFGFFFPKSPGPFSMGPFFFAHPFFLLFCKASEVLGLLAVDVRGGFSLSFSSLIESPPFFPTFRQYPSACSDPPLLKECFRPGPGFFFENENRLEASGFP